MRSRPSYVRHHLRRGLTAVLLLVALVAVSGVLPGAASALVPLTTVAGTVSLPGGAPAVGVVVSAYDTMGTPVDSATTGDDGKYTLSMTPDSVVIGFDPSVLNDGSGPYYQTQYYAGTTSFYAATVLDLNASGSVTGIDATLVEGALVTGTVADGSGGAVNATVELYQEVDPWVPYTTLDVSALTWAAVVPPGKYYVHAIPTDYPTTLVDTWHDGQADVYSADLLTLATGVTNPEVALVLAQGGSISGTATDGSDAGVGMVYVTVLDQSGVPAGSGSTKPDGTYLIDGLKTGSYTLRFDPPAASGLVSQCYNAKPLDGGYDTADVTLGVETKGIDAKLGSGGSIRGTVTDGAGAPVAGADVWVYSSDFFSSWSAVTDADGAYSVSQIPFDSLYVFVDPRPYNDATGSNLRARMDSGVPVRDTTPVVHDRSLADGAEISGIVSGPSGPVEGIWVQAIEVHAGGGPVGVSTAADGSYTIRGLDPGEWTLNLSAADYNTMTGAGLVSQYWNGKSSIDVADSFPLIGAMRKSLDVTLEKGGTVSGDVVRPADADMLSDGVALIEMETGRAIRGASADDFNGNVFELTEVPAGTYTLRAGEDPFWEYGNTRWGRLPRYLGDVAELADATTFTVDPGGSRGGFTITLPKAGSISGTVTGDGGAPLANVEMTFFDSDGRAVDKAWTGPDGTYRTAPVFDTEGYRIEFDPTALDAASGDSYAISYSGGAATLADATPVAAVAGADSAVGDAVLSQTGATLSGTLTPRTAGIGFGNRIQVAAYTLVDGQPFLVAETLTDAQGVYSFKSLPAGDYLLQIMEFGGGNPKYYVTTQWLGSTGVSGAALIPVERFDLAQTFTLTAGDSLTVDYEYIFSGSGMIRVTDDDGAPLAGVSFAIEREIPGHGWIDVTDVLAPLWTSGTPDTDSQGQCFLGVVFPGTYRFDFGKYGYRTAVFGDSAGVVSSAVLRAASSGFVVDETGIGGMFTIEQTLVPAVPVSTFLIGGAPAVDPSAWTTSTQVACTISADLVGTTTHFRVDEGSWETTTAFAMDVSSEGTTTIEYLGVSALGAREATSTMRIRIDTSVPTVGFDTADGTYTGAKTVTFTGTDAVSGVAGYEYRIDSGTVLSGASVVLAPRGAAYTLEARAIDRAGNVSAWSSRAITVQEDVVVPPAKTATAISIRTSATSVRLPKPFQLSGELNPGKYLDPVVVWVKKPGSGRWSYSSLRLAYKANTDGSSTWWYRYTPRLRGTYTFKARFAGDSTRLGCTSPNTVAVRVR